MRIHHLNCGTTRPFGGRLVDGRGHPFRSARGICHCLLIETGQGLVLVDSGFGMTDVQRPLESLGRPFLAMSRPRLDPEETAIRQVTRLGYAPGDVRHIVLTHLDVDHAGGLPDFPWAKVHLHEAEHAQAASSRYSKVQLAHGPDWVTHSSAGGDRWFGFEAIRQLQGLPADLLLVPLPGHSRGHTAVAVRAQPATGSGPQWLLHAGDAYFYHGEIDPARPRTPPGLRLFQTVLQTDGNARRHNQARLRELAAEHGAQVAIFSAHDPQEMPSPATPSLSSLSSQPRG
jgi:glyoxylase-like metal-dependent hydrolase (beta-lactamase superfamily II)